MTQTCSICKSNDSKHFRYYVGDLEKQLTRLKYSYFYKLLNFTNTLTKSKLSFINNTLYYYDHVLDSFFKGDIIHCLNCKHGYWNCPPSDEILNFYYKFGYRNIIPLATIRIPYFKYVIGKISNLFNYNVVIGLRYLRNIIYKYPKWSSRPVNQIDFVISDLKNFDKRELLLLEIGGSVCQPLRLLREKLIGKLVNIDCVEPDKQYKQRYLRENINLVSEYFPFKCTKQYDYIHTSHWLEHVVDWKITLRDIREILCENGLLFIEVPNANNIDSLKGDHSEIPHIHFFSATSLKLCLQNLGYDIVRMEVKEGVIKALSRKSTINFCSNA